MANLQRLEHDIETLRQISDPCEGGVTRIGLTPTYRQGIDYVKQQMVDLALEVREDDIGNIYGVLPGKNRALPSIVTGSHLDTVRNAGAFDGIAGVVCGLEVIRMFKEANIHLDHTIEILATVEEEGTHFGTVLLGSRFIAGELTEQDKTTICNEEGCSLQTILNHYSQGINTVPVLRNPKTIKAFLELHDEQGPVLEATNTDIGIVNSIVAIEQMTVTIMGFAGHAGTVPMTLRSDAGVAGCLFVADLNRFILRKYADNATVTVGKFALHPNSANCIPDQCHFTLDIRSGCPEIITDIVAYITQLAILIGHETSTHFESKKISFKAPIVMDIALRQIIAQSCQDLGYSYKNLNSGAGHDAMVMAGICPTAMLFIPCHKGITHHPDENVTWEAMAKGTDVLYRTILVLDKLQ